MVTQTVNLDLVPSQFGRSNVTVPCSQYDKEFRVIQFVIYNKKALFNIPSDSVVTIRGTKPQDNTGFEYECEFSGNLVSFPIQPQITIYNGLIPAELRITKNGEIIGSANFVFMVEESPLKDNTVISDTDLPLLQEALNAVDETLSYRNDAETFSQDAEAWAVGQRNGEDVESDDPTYENNSKYYSEQAYASEQSASQSSSDASGYKNDAKNYRDEAKGYRDEAMQSSSDAYDYKELAKGYKNDAYTSEVNAKASEDNAKDSENNALSYKNDAKSYRDDALSYKNDASGYKDDALSYKNEAKGYRDDAYDYKTDANTYKTEAKGYRDEAYGFKNEASQSKTDAKGYRDDALQYKNDASGYKDDASASATSASTNALKSEGFAVGQQNGTDVSSGSPYYENNAKYYAQQAETSAEQAEAVLEEVIGIKDNFAEKDGFYPDMSVGHLLSDTTVDDEFTYQVTNYDGKAKINSIKGNTLKWNQLIQNGNFADTSNWVATNGSLSASGNIGTFTAESSAIYLSQLIVLPTGHKFFYSVDLKSDDVTYENKIAFGAQQTILSRTITNSWQTLCGIANKTGDNVNFNVIRTTGSGSGMVSGSTVNVRNCFIIDLTAMFGTTKADEIYAMETAQSGSGVAYFRSLYPLPYYQYDAGSLQSFNGSGVKTVGFNLWDEEWEQGQYNTTNGAKANGNTDRIRSKNYIKCFPSTAYFYQIPSDKGNMQIFFYDQGKNYIDFQNFGTDHHIVTPSNCYFITFSTGGSYGGTYTNDICINISDVSKNGTYEPYTSSIKPLPIGHINIWDEEWELGYWDSNGVKQQSANNICCSNPVPVLPNTTYYTSYNYQGGMRVYCLDANRNVISDLGYKKETTFDTPSNCAYIVWYSNASDVLRIYNHDICINVSDSAINGQYVPYMESYFSSGMKDIDGDTYGKVYDELTSSKAITRIGSVDLGSLTWVYDSTYQRFNSAITNAKQIGSPRIASIKCAKFECITDGRNITAVPDKSIYRGSNYDLSVHDSAYNDATTFKTAMSGVMLQYQLGIPTEVDIDVDLSYDIEKGGTEQLLPINTDVPVTSPLSRNVTFYFENEDVNNLAKILAMIAPVENKTVSKAYTVGQYLIYDYVLYKVTSNIANGGTITVGTNVTATSIASILESM